MRRREFITLLGAALAWPLAAHAQQRTIPIIGYLSALPRGSRDFFTAFNGGLSEAGFVDGRNVTMDYRFADGRVERLPELAADLVRRRVSVIVAAANVSAIAAKAATSTIPIVFLVAADPIHLGLVTALNRPGGNATGVTLFANMLVAKHLELLHEIKPSASLIAYLVKSDNPNAETDVKQVRAAADRLGVKLLVVNARTERDLEGAFATFAERRAGAVLVAADPSFIGWRGQLAALAARHALPAIYPLSEFAEAGGLMAYGASRLDGVRQAAVYAGRILKGEKPGDLPVLQPTRIELVINLKTAKALGLTIPPSLLLRADQVIE